MSHCRASAPPRASTATTRLPKSIIRCRATAPATIYKYDVVSGESTLFKAPEVNFDPSLFTTEQVFYTSKDGTKVPMFITRRKDLKLDGKNPCYLYAYGGFQINRTPGFRPSAIMFVEQGGVFCEANLRGGSEYGEAWHKAGMLENKQNVFDAIA